MILTFRIEVVTCFYAYEASYGWLCSKWHYQYVSLDSALKTFDKDFTNRTHIHDTSELGYDKHCICNCPNHSNWWQHTVSLLLIYYSLHQLHKLASDPLEYQGLDRFMKG